MKTSKEIKKKKKHFILSVLLEQRTTGTYRPVSFGNSAWKPNHRSMLPSNCTIMVVVALKVGTCYNIHFKKAFQGFCLFCSLPFNKRKSGNNKIPQILSYKLLTSFWGNLCYARVIWYKCTSWKQNRKQLIP